MFRFWSVLFRCFISTFEWYKKKITPLFCLQWWIQEHSTYFMSTNPLSGDCPFFVLSIKIPPILPVLGVATIVYLMSPTQIQQKFKVGSYVIEHHHGVKLKKLSGWIRARLHVKFVVQKHISLKDKIKQLQKLQIQHMKTIAAMYN